MTDYVCDTCGTQDPDDHFVHYDEPHLITTAEWWQFWYDEDPGIEYRRPIRRARRAMIINPDLLRDGYVDEDEGIWQ